MERVFALAKAIIHGQMGGFRTDFSIYLQIQKLADLGLVELRGDLYGEPRVKCIASDQEVGAVAGIYDFRLQEYLNEA
jgi:hypothetical protein